jgi:hypothetical protein
VRESSLWPLLPLFKLRKSSLHFSILLVIFILSSLKKNPFLVSHGDILFVGVANGIVLKDPEGVVAKLTNGTEAPVVVEDQVDVELAKQSGRISRKKEPGTTMKMADLPIEVCVVCHTSFCLLLLLFSLDELMIFIAVILMPAL